MVFSRCILLLETNPCQASTLFLVQTPCSSSAMFLYRTPGSMQLVGGSCTRCRAAWLAQQQGSSTLAVSC